jgi:hypothetical protein
MWCDPGGAPRAPPSRVWCLRNGQLCGKSMHGVDKTGAHRDGAAFAVKKHRAATRKAHTPPRTGRAVPRADGERNAKAVAAHSASPGAVRQWVRAHVGLPAAGQRAPRIGQWEPPCPWPPPPRT